jgi:hypothetical protein
LTALHHANLGAGPGRNAGLDAWAGSTPYTLMVDGGILPIRGSIKAMKDYLERHPEVHVISPEVASAFTTEFNESSLTFPDGTIEDRFCFRQSCLSSTAYALCRAEAWKVHFSEEGPFAEPGWGVDDNDMAYRWNRAGIVHHDFSSEIGVKFYRRKSGSFKRLFDEIGVWPAGYGSVYEKRLVKLWQDYPEQGNQWNHFGEYPLKVSCVMLGWNEYPMFTRAIKALHDDLKDIPHEIIFVNNGSTDETTWWLDTYALRQHHGDITIDAKTGAIIKRGKDNEAIWTGNVIRVDLPENAGAGHGYNEGFKRARGEYIFYLSGDILPVIGSVSALAEYLDKTSDTD